MEASLRVPSKSAFSCVRCADRKVKCDREQPCSACSKHNVDCVFNSTRPPRKRRARLKDQVLTDRLRQYEALLQGQGVDLSKLSTIDAEPRPGSTQSLSDQLQTPPSSDQIKTPSSNMHEPSQTIHKTQVVHSQGRFRLVENPLWARMLEEFHDSPDDAFEDSSNDGSDMEMSDRDSTFVLSSQHKSQKRISHPPSDQILQLWQIFIDNVDPLTKIIHVPTVRPAIQKAANDTKTVPRSFEALMFAIYSAAVMSINNNECKQRFGEPRKALLSRYISATKAALSRARFMGAISLIVLQALIIHIISVRDMYDARTIWSLNGVALRIAQSMGLERDGTTLDLPVFETEIRRRVWWLLKTHDSRTAELCGLAKFRYHDSSAESTKWPTNLNDSQLYPGMQVPVAESSKITDMVFISLRHELNNFAATCIAKFREQGKEPSQWELSASGSEKVEIDRAFKEVEEIIESKYLRYCDPSQPLHLMAMLMGRFAMNIIRFLTHHPRRWASIEQTPYAERQLVWETSIKLLDQHNMVQLNPQLTRFAWHALYFMPWHAFIHILDTLRAIPMNPEADKAWQLISYIYENNPDMILDSKKPIHIAVGNLCLKAYSAREAALQNESEYLPPTPIFILQLRQQREAAKSKKQSQEVSRAGPRLSANGGSTWPPESVPGRDTSALQNTGYEKHTTMQEAAPLLPLNASQSDNSAENGSFWFINGYDDSHLGSSNDAMDLDLDLDFMMPPDPATANTNPPSTIDWQQFDAWLTESNMLPPLSYEA